MSEAASRTRGQKESAVNPSTGDRYESADEFEYEIDGDELLASFGYTFEAQSEPAQNLVPTDSASEPEAEPESANSARQINALEEENKLLRISVERLKKECQTIRSRFERERENTRQMLQGDLMLQVLPLMDNFDRAMDHLSSSEVGENFVAGVILLYKQLLNLLEQNQVTPIETTGNPFDPEIHEAVVVEPAEGIETNTIIAELEKGYTIGNRLLRPARVKVAGHTS